MDDKTDGQRHEATWTDVLCRVQVESRPPVSTVPLPAEVASGPGMTGGLKRLADAHLSEQFLPFFF